MKKISILLFLALVLFSCENRTDKQKQQKEIVEIEDKKELIIEMYFKTNKEDTFKFLMNNIKVDEFQSKNIQILEKVSPSTAVDQMSFNFENNKPNSFIINLGNKHPKEVTIKNIVVKYGENIVEINKSNFKRYTVPNKFIEINEEGTLITKKIDGKHNPSLVLKKNVFNQVFKTTK